MDRIDKIIPQSLEMIERSKEHSEPAAPSMLTERHMAHLWQRMAHIYGHRWISSYGEFDPNKAAGTWLAGLGDLSPEQIAAGLHQCLREADEWPPSLPKFRLLCLEIDEEDIDQEIKVMLGSYDYGMMTYDRLAAYKRQHRDQVIARLSSRRVDSQQQALPPPAEVKTPVRRLTPEENLEYLAVARQRIADAKRDQLTRKLQSQGKEA